VQPFSAKEGWFASALAVFLPQPPLDADTSDPSDLQRLYRALVFFKKSRLTLPRHRSLRLPAQRAHESPYGVYDRNIRTMSRWRLA
jgi:hypothetical protein